MSLHYRIDCFWNWKGNYFRLTSTLLYITQYICTYVIHVCYMIIHYIRLSCAILHCYYMMWCYSIRHYIILCYSKVMWVFYPTLGAPIYSALEWETICSEKALGWDRVLSSLFSYATNSRARPAEERGGAAADVLGPAPDNVYIYIYTHMCTYVDTHTST